jgi:hypothetical protein
MVAYNFKTAFHGPIKAGTKRQTVRAHGRKRHARPGEPVQIYAGLRTRSAAKLIEDPTCIGVDEIIILVDRSAPQKIAAVEINGIPLDRSEMEAFAVADGFFPIGDHPALEVFGRFWLATHGEGRFDGVVIRW